ncbi:MAG: hypothetical protein JWO13_3472 [Acidobacteriales bacterium]|nr:hypothetical protein [Terriglobales bacterium]
MDPDKDLLQRVVAAIDKADFFRSILQNDNFDDWNLAKECGEFLVRIEPEDVMGHALLVRAHRHLGNLQKAREELQQCELMTRGRELTQGETELFVPLLTQEEKLLG